MLPAQQYKLPAQQYKLLAQQLVLLAQQYKIYRDARKKEKGSGEKYESNRGKALSLLPGCPE